MQKQKTALVNGRIFNGDDSFLGHALLLEGDRIHGIFPQHAIPEDYIQLDVDNGNICAGLIDLQIYGTGDDLFSAQLSAESLHKIEQQILAQGCTSFMMTLATNTLSVFKEAIRIFEAAQPKIALGLHLEGPFLNVNKRGAHPAALILPPTPENIDRLLEENQGSVKMMTVAPELIDKDAIDSLLERGILLSAGHSAATFAEATAGFHRGIKTTTHLWNAMSPLHHRETGLPGATVQHQTTMASIIVDGIHVDYEAVKISKQLMQDRLFLITDAVGGCNEGVYQHVRNNDHYTLPDGTLSGSALTMLGAVKNCVEQAGIPLEEAIRMATTYPARLIDREDLGNLNSASVANVLVFDAHYNVQSVFFEGVKRV
ncbi:N-acetylglucosamine-6-phosphate deacetylase [Sphingobacterium paludis]|uniref:N-acetylglucosamine-6-phosphate deacetylase n=1 Tax=Sphingobacterium paludis TaxID=1476465 RepID=A0A4R7CR10_9SPHI|nr:N-acetylglucosamine-6-phosphate deacetylase [Sphingobacterium paludis]TDS08418.1 N-acetylglucosamine-6-phosphate deacetylase [Sphingobacterium paludis]